MTKQKATLIGLIAIVLWSTMVGLIRGVSEGLGPAGGAAMIFTLSGLLLIFTVGFPNIRKIPVRYLIAGSVLFVREGANKQVISSQADSLIKISRIWADFFPANTSNQPV